MHELDQGELLQLMEWLDYYNTQVGRHRILKEDRARRSRIASATLGKSCGSTSTTLIQHCFGKILDKVSFDVSQIVSLGATGSCSEFVTALSVCLQEYLVRVRTQARHRSLIPAFY